MIDRGHVVVDLTAVRFMDSSMLGALVDVRKRILAADGTLILVCSAARHVRLFDLTRLDRLFLIVPTMTDWHPVTRPDEPRTASRPT